MAAAAAVEERISGCLIYSGNVSIERNSRIENQEHTKLLSLTSSNYVTSAGATVGGRGRLCRGELSSNKVFSFNYTLVEWRWYTWMAGKNRIHGYPHGTRIPPDGCTRILLCMHEFGTHTIQNSYPKRARVPARHHF